MTNLHVLAQRSLGAVVFATMFSAPLATPLAAQQPAQAKLAFGYHCDNKFALRNEGTQTADVDFTVLGTADRGRITVKPNETVQIESVTQGDVELYVDGRLVATEHKGNRPCDALTSPMSGTVTVRHLDQSEVVYVQPQAVEQVYVSPPVVYTRPYYYPYASSFSLSLGFPIFAGYGGWYGSGYSSGYSGWYGGGYRGGSRGHVTVVRPGRVGRRR